MYFAKIESKKALFCLNVCERGNSFTREKLTLGKNAHWVVFWNAKKKMHTSTFSCSFPEQFFCSSIMRL